MAPKPKANGFLMFMIEFKERKQKQGRKFKNGLKDIQNDAECNQEWQSFTPEKKAEYNRRAKQEKREVKKKTGVGEIMSEVEKQRSDKLKFEQNMNDDIECNIARCMEFGILPDEKFYFIHANWFHTRSLEDGEFDYVPAEFAVAEFSLRSGVENIYHEIIRTEIRMGFAREAMETSQETHQLPWNIPTAEDRFDVMGKKLLKFMESNKKDGVYPPLYTARKINAPVKALLKRMVDSLNLGQSTFVLYDVEVLFLHCRNAAMEQSNMQENFKVVMAEYELIKDAFSYAPGLDCEFHKNLDGTSQYCSKSNVQRWAFTICDYCCESLGIKLKAGVHLPAKSVEIDETESVQKKMQELHIKETICIKSITGVSNEYRTKVSERSDEQDRLRRYDKRPFSIVDHKEDDENLPSSDPSSSFTPIIDEYMRPLRAPHTKSHAVVVGKKNDHLFHESEFPSLGVSAGRGSGLRKQQNGNKPAGRGRGIAFC